MLSPFFVYGAFYLSEHLVALLGIDLDLAYFSVYLVLVPYFVFFSFRSVLRGLLFLPLVLSFSHFVLFSPIFILQCFTRSLVLTVFF